MKIYFDIQYKTAFGEELLLNVEGQDESADSVLMLTGRATLTSRKTPRS